MRKNWALPLLLALVGLSPTIAIAQGDDLQPQTTADPAISLLDLGDKLRAPTADELVAEVDAWQRLVRDKIAEIAETNILIRAAGDDVAVTAPLTERVTAFSAEKTALLERFEAAFLALEKKGGDGLKYRAYYGAVSGILADTADAGAATSALLNWLKSAEGGILWAKRIGLALLTLIVFRFFAGLASGITGAALRRSKLKISEGLRRFFTGMAKKTVFILGVVIALSVLGVDIGPFIAAIGVGGFVLGFALQETLGNFAAGILILMYRPFEIGDVVEAAGVMGKIEDISLVSTRFLTPDNQRIIVPNGSVWGGVIRNVTGNTQRRVDMQFGIGYGDDIAKAEAVLRRIVEAHPMVLEDPEPQIKVHALGDSSVNFICRPWAKTSDYWDVFWDVTRAVKEQFDAEGISIPFPQRDVHLHQVT